MLRQPMGTRILSSILNALFWCVLLVVITGGFDWHGSIGERAVRVDATSPDLFALLFVILLVIWSRLGRSPREIECVRIWERFYARLDNANAGRWLPVLGLMAAVLVALPLARHFTFQSGYDLALFAQAYWNTLQGDFLYSSLKGGMVLWGDHFNPIALAIVPLYRLWPAPETLLVIQSLALLAGVFPLYALARRELSERGLALVIAAAYLLYLPLRQINSFDFHPIALATPLILTAFYYLRTEALLKFLLFCLLIGATKETGPIAVGLLGAAYFGLGRRRWLGATVTLISGFWFYANLAWVMPAFNATGVDTQLARYSYLGESPGEILLTLLTRPLYVISENLSSRELFYPFRVLAPVVFLPLLTPLGLLILPYMVINLLESSGVQVWLVHYQAELTAFVFIATVFGAQRARHRFTGRTMAAVLTCGVFLFFGTSDVYRLRKSMPSAESRRIHAALDRLPAEASVSAQAALAPHLSRRSRLYFFPEVSDVEWVVVDMGLDPWPVRPDRFRRTVRRLKRQGFQVQFEDGQTRLIRQTGQPFRRQRKRR